MSTADLIARIKRLDALYLAYDAARTAFIDNPSSVTMRRMFFYERRYKAFVEAYDETERTEGEVTDGE